MHYNMMRYYDPSLGRYITSDPIGLDGGMNTYGYAMQNPIYYYSPDGLNPLSRIACDLALALKEKIEQATKWCASWRCKIELHDTRYYFPELERKECHVQFAFCRKGVKKSDIKESWPYPCDKKSPPFVPDRRKKY